VHGFNKNSAREGGSEHQVSGSGLRACKNPLDISVVSFEADGNMVETFRDTPLLLLRLPVYLCFAKADEIIVDYRE